MNKTRVAVAGAAAHQLAQRLERLGYEVAATTAAAHMPAEWSAADIAVAVVTLPTFQPGAGAAFPAGPTATWHGPVVVLCHTPARRFGLRLHLVHPHAVLDQSATDTELHATVEMVLAQQRARQALEVAYREVSQAGQLRDKIEAHANQVAMDAEITGLIHRLVTRIDQDGVAAIADEVLRTLMGLGGWTHGYVVGPTELEGHACVVAQCHANPIAPPDHQRLVSLAAETRIGTARMATDSERSAIATAHGAAVGNALWLPLETRTRAPALVLLIDGPRHAFLDEWRRPTLELMLQVGLAWRRRLDDATRRKLSSAVEQSPVGILIADRTGCIEYANPRFLEMSGFAMTELMGKRSVDFWPQNEALFAELQSTLEAGESWRGDIPGFRKGGASGWYSSAFVPIRDASDDTTHYLAVHQDVTARKAMEEALSRAREQADEANRVKSEFLANMSHEIRTPMNGVLGMAELLQATSLDATQRFYIRTVQASARTLMTIINDLLEFSRVEAGKLTIEQHPFELDELVDETASQYLVRDQPEVGFVASVAPEMPRNLLGDPVRLRQIIGNLLNNAFKFTQQGMVVLRLDVHERTADQVIIRGTVLDTGIGIAREALARLFEPFYQVRLRGRGPHQGTGLGLAICQRLLEAMGGKIDVTSTPGDGSRFIFTLPLGIGGDETSTEPASAHGLRLLFVDDLAEYRAVIAEQTAALGVALRFASAAEVVAETRRWQPDAIAIGLDSATEHGLDADRQLAACPEVCDVPRLLLTAGLHNRDGSPGGLGSGNFLKPSGPRGLARLLEIARGPSLPPTEVGAVPPVSASRVLLVEDNLVNRQVVCAMLVRLGHVVEMVEDGAQAVRRMASEAAAFDLVLMDLEMPNMNGYEAARVIRQREQAEQRDPVPIIALTAHALPEYQRLSLAAGMTAHLTKPISMDSLRRALARYL